jgi:hypothetical protein
MELSKGEGEGGVDVLEGGKSPAVGLVEEGVEANPAGGDIGSGEGEDILAGSGLAAVVDGVDLDEAGEFPLLRGVEGTEEIRCLRAPAGLVRLLPLRARAALSFLRARSIVAGLIDTSFSLAAAVIAKAGQPAMKGICWRMRGAKSFPHLYQKKAQMRRREAMASSV